MRWSFLLLLILNLFYAIWHQQQRAAPVQPTASRAPLSGASDIRLLHEWGSSQPAPVPSAQRDCTLLGSYPDRQGAAALQQRLRAMDVSSEIVAIDSAGNSDFWVYLAPLSSAEASLRQLRELHARHLEGYLIPEGDLAYGISLGIFPQQSAATALMQQMQAAGYEPRLRELPHAQRSFWLSVAPESERLVTPSLIDGLSKQFAGLAVDRQPCPGIASAGRFE